MYSNNNNDKKPYSAAAAASSPVKYAADGQPLLKGEPNYYNNNGAAHYADAYGGNVQASPYVQGIPLYEGDAPSSASRFVVTGYKDVWASALFALAMVGSVGLAAFNAKSVAGDDDRLSSDDRKTLDALKVWAPVAAVLTWLLSGLVLTAMRLFAKQFIVAANVFVILLDIGIAAYAFSKSFIWMAVLFALCACLQSLWLFLVRRRIPLATVLLSTSSRLVLRFHGTLWISLMGLLAGLVFFAVWAVAAFPVARNLRHDENGNAAAWNYPAGVGLLLLLLWVCQVCLNVVHVTGSGAIATWYFCGESNVPPNPSIASAKRAMTTSFGSIAFGSLMVALVKLIYYLVRAARHHANNDFAMCLLECIIGIIERLFEWFNVYAFTHIAIYGTSYIEAAKQTWHMVKECGWAAYFNDCLVWPVLTFTCLFTGLAVGVGFGLATEDVLVGVVSFFISYIVMLVSMRPVYAGIVTQFVCIAECPDALQVNHVEYFQQIEAATEALHQPIC